MKLKIYNKKAPLATFEALNQRNLEDLLQDGKIYNKGLYTLLSDTLTRYENVQNTVNFTANTFNPINYFSLILPKIDSEMLETVDSARLFEKTHGENEVSLLDFSDYNIDLNDTKVVDKFNTTNIESTLGDVIDIAEDSCLDLLKGFDDSKIIKPVENKGQMNLCDFTLGEKELDFKENRFSMGGKTTNFGRSTNDNIQLKTGRKSSNILASKNQNNLKSSGKSTPFIDFSRYKKDNKKMNKLKKQYSDISSRTKTPPPSHPANGKRRSTGQFLSPPPILNNYSSIGITFNAVFNQEQNFQSNNTTGNVTPLKFGKQKSRNELPGKVKTTFQKIDEWKKNEEKSISSAQKMRFNSKSPIFMRLKHKNKSKTKSKSPLNGKTKKRKRSNEGNRSQFILTEKSKKLLASKPTRATIPSNYHQQLIKLIDGYSSNYDFSDSSNFSFIIF